MTARKNKSPDTLRIRLRFDGMPDLKRALKVAKELNATLANVQERMRYLDMAARTEFKHPFMRPRKRRARK